MDNGTIGASSKTAIFYPPRIVAPTNTSFNARIRDRIDERRRRKRMSRARIRHRTRFSHGGHLARKLESTLPNAREDYGGRCRGSFRMGATTPKPPRFTATHHYSNCIATACDLSNGQ